MNEIIEQIKPKMQKALESLAHEFNKIRTGRANPNILDAVKIDYYGNPTPINQAANISVEEGRTLAISPWDKSLIGEIEKAIMKSDLGINPSTSGDLIRVTMPVLTEETRQEYIKQARTEAENSRISIRNTRRDANNSAKDQQKAGEFSEDDLKRIEDLVQKETDHFISLVDSELKKKEEDLIEI
ncbi:MAG: ribosome recycling factor [SAR86 cluster bacterium]|jgi:ribosome recycling factor|nr:ribosome recycling factor [Gammaproteobacteria bacterium]MDG0966125.1 ribosome recycling factor [SAR86 cluster bacterium]MDG2347220.1 ribosome recycling factor [SAR86 cluster bacterium]|tara:strand:- start:390 stop:944 length:555 start_codon:yes stop_codon:yes gene_type:complete